MCNVSVPGVSRISHKKGCLWEILDTPGIILLRISYASSHPHCTQHLS